MDRMIKVEYDNQDVKEFVVNTPLVEVAKEFQNRFEYPILIARVDNSMKELSELLTKKVKLNFMIEVV